MLERIPEPQTKEERIAAFFQYRDIVARCPDTGAILERSRKQWTLLCGDEVRHKSRWNKKECRSVSIEEAMVWGNRALAKITTLPEDNKKQ